MDADHSDYGAITRWTELGAKGTLYTRLRPTEGRPPAEEYCVRRLFVAILCLLSAFGYPAHASIPTQTPALPHLGADIRRTSVSGLSSGGFMAVQYAVAFSETTIGAGIVAGGPYGCAAYGSPVAGGPTALQRAAECIKGQNVTAPGMAQLLDKYRELGLIDSPQAIARQRIYLFHGSGDTVVSDTTMDALDAFYRARISRPNALAYIRTIKAGHAFLSDNLVGDCAILTAPPYISRCFSGTRVYDQPGAILRHIFKRLRTKTTRLSSSPQPFDQRAFQRERAGLDDTGYLYVPADCRKSGSRCSVHVVFHGCMQSARGAGAVVGVGDAIYGRLGYNEWADTNRIIVLYPQVLPSAATPLNPLGCWDWWGYDGKMKGQLATFPTREGAQLSAIHAMVRELATTRP